MTEPIVIELGWIPPAEVRGNSRAHWAKKHCMNKRLHASGWAHAYGVGFGMREGQARITFDFHHWRPIDLDNLAIGMKPWVDGLTMTGMFLDDDPDHVIYGEHTFTKTQHKGESRTIVKIEELA